MYGWIPLTYDTMPWSPWGGYLNMPREIVQHKDGTLGGRMDPGLKEKLSYGKVFSCESFYTENDEKLIVSSLERNMVSFKVNLNNSTDFSYILKQDSNNYCINITKEDGKAYLSITSPNDSKHKINSKIEISNKESYDVYFLNDGEFIEAFVDDEYALTAHTSMKNSKYDAYIKSNNPAEVQYFSVNKLIPYWNINN